MTVVISGVVRVLLSLETCISGDLDFVSSFYFNFLRVRRGMLIRMLGPGVIRVDGLYSDRD